MRVLTDAGETIDLGTTETAPTIGIIDYSRRVTDDFGVTTVVERGFARRMSVRLAVPSDQVDALQRRLAGLRATPALWVADDRFQSLSVRGFYKDFALDLAVPPLSYCTLTIEGLAAAEPFTDPGGDPAPDGKVSTLQLLRPADVTTGALVASSVAENDYPAWVAGTSYAIGARVIKVATHRIYESAAAANVGNDPAGASGKWIDIGPTNRWAMFDQALGSLTTKAGSIAVTLSAGSINAVALLDVTAATVRVQAPGFDRTVAAGSGAITFLDLPTTSGQVTVTIAGPGQVSVGTLLMGKLAGLGITEAAPTAGITDYSRKEVDDFGAVTVVPRAWAKRMITRALIRTDALDLVANRVAAVRARPSLWIGQAGLDSLTVYGFFKDFSIEVGESVSKLSLSIEGLSAAAKLEPLKAAVDWPAVGDPDGTKPADNATNSSDPASPLGPDTTVGDVLRGIEGGTFAQIVEAATAETNRLRDRALNFPGPAGESIYTLHVREVTRRTSDKEVFAETFDLLGAVNGDRSAFVLNAQTVRVTPDETLAQRFDRIATTFGENQASIEETNQIVVGPEGGTARALLTLNVNGKISGFANTNDGTTSAAVFSVDSFRLEDPETGQPYLYADDSGIVRARDVVVDTLEVGSVKTNSMTLGAAQKAAFYTLPADTAVPKGTTVQIRDVYSTPTFKTARRSTASPPRSVARHRAAPARASFRFRSRRPAPIRSRSGPRHPVGSRCTGARRAGLQVSSRRVTFSRRPKRRASPTPLHRF